MTHRESMSHDTQRVCHMTQREYVTWHRGSMSHDTGGEYVTWHTEREYVTWHTERISNINTVTTCSHALGWDLQGQCQGVWELGLTCWLLPA